MSFVTTASSSSPPRVRQSAATSAVLPDPTGPPMPTRNGPPRRCPPPPRCSCGSPPGTSCGSTRGSGRKEPLLPGGVTLGQQVEQGVRVVREVEEVEGIEEIAAGGLARDVSHIIAQPQRRRGDGQRVEREQPLRGGGRS